jgi:hypothetical protein
MKNDKSVGFFWFIAQFLRSFFQKKIKVSKNLNQTDLNRQNQEPIFQSCVGAAETRVLPGHTHPLTEKWVRKPSIRAAMPTEY